MAHASPGALLHRDKSLRRKHAFAVEHLGLSSDEFAREPELLCASLLHVTGPRYHLLRERGLAARVHTAAGRPLVASRRDATGTRDVRAAAEERGTCGAERPAGVAGAAATARAGAALGVPPGVTGRQRPGVARIAPQGAGCAGAECISLAAMVTCDLLGFCRWAEISADDFKAFQVEWWRTQSLQWGGVNMQLPEDMRGWHAHGGGSAVPGSW